MNGAVTRTTRPTPHARRWLRSIIVALVALLGVSLQTPSASALQYYNASGWYGGVTPYKVSHYDHWTSAPGAVVMAGLLVGGPVVTRSNGSVGAQKVGITHVLTRYAGDGWTSTEQWTAYYWIPAGATQVKLPDFKRSANASGGRFNVRIGLAWYDSANRWLGQRAVNYDGGTSDYSCVYSHYVGCFVYNGSISIGTSR